MMSLASLGNCSCIALIPSIPGHMLPPAAPMSVIFDWNGIGSVIDRKKSVVPFKFQHLSGEVVRVFDQHIDDLQAAGTVALTMPRELIA